MPVIESINPADRPAIAVTPVGKSYRYWYTWGEFRGSGDHYEVIDYDRKRRYLDGKRVPWS